MATVVLLTTSVAPEDAQVYVDHVLAEVGTWPLDVFRRRCVSAANEARVCVFRFHRRSDGWWPVVSAMCSKSDGGAGALVLFVDSYNGDMNAPGWTVRGAHVLPELQRLHPAMCASRMPLCLLTMTQ
jgi:hypothetical protein